MYNNEEYFFDNYLYIKNVDKKYKKLNIKEFV